jgi:hypothetical protein
MLGVVHTFNSTHIPHSMAYAIELQNLLHCLRKTQSNSHEIRTDISSEKLTCASKSVPYLRPHQELNV